MATRRETVERMLCRALHALEEFQQSVDLARAECDDAAQHLMDVERAARGAQAEVETLEALLKTVEDA